jgi:hypothetical protein
MAKVNQADFCKKCNTELPSPHPAYCPNGQCQARLGDPVEGTFGTPQYLWYQYEDAFSSLKASAVSKSEEDKNISKTDAVAKQEAALKKDLVNWLKGCPSEDVIACAEDLLMHAQHVFKSSLTREEQIRLIGLCEAIHELTSAASKFILAGGYTDGRHIDTPNSGDDSRNQENLEGPGHT